MAGPLARRGRDHVADSGNETILNPAAFIWSLTDLPQGGDDRWARSC
jgi:hypothetical protein